MAWWNKQNWENDDGTDLIVQSRRMPDQTDHYIGEVYAHSRVCGKKVYLEPAQRIPRGQYDLAE